MLEWSCFEAFRATYLDTISVSVTSLEPLLRGTQVGLLEDFVQSGKSDSKRSGLNLSGISADWPLFLALETIGENDSKSMIAVEVEAKGLCSTLIMVGRFSVSK